MERHVNVKAIIKAAAYLAIIPFVASIPGFAVLFTGVPWTVLFVVPSAAVLIYALFRRKFDMRFAAVCNGAAFLILLICFTLVMMIAKGAVEGVVIGYYSVLLFPFAPVMLLLMLMGANLILYGTAFLT